MTFALQNARLWDYVMGSARKLPELIEKSDNSKERKERIYQRWKEIRDFDLDVLKTSAKISRMCTDTVQKEFLAVKNSTEWNPKDLWDWLKKRYTLQNFASKWNALDKLHAIRHSECKNVSEYMSRIKDIAAEIEGLKISISEAIVIHALNNLDSHFRPFLAILSHDARQKEALPTLSELTKTLEDEQMRLSNENKGTANYARSSKSKKAKPSEQGGKEGMEKGSDNEGEKKKHEVRECKTCGGKHQGDCWHLKTECFICHNVGHIAAKCPEKSSSASSSSSTKKKLCYTQKVTTQHPDSKTKVGQVLASCLVGSRPQKFSVTSVIIDSGATDHFFSNRDLFSTYTEYEHEFETGSGEKIAAHGYGNVDLRMSDLKGNINTLTVTNVSWAPELGHNLLSTIPLAKKSVELFLRKTGQTSKIIVDKEVFDLVNIIKNQDVIRLAKNPKIAMVNQVTALTIETWHAQIGHLGYKSLLALPKLA